MLWRQLWGHYTVTGTTRNASLFSHENLVGPEAAVREAGGVPERRPFCLESLSPTLIPTQPPTKSALKGPQQLVAPVASAAGEQTPVAASLWIHLSLQVSEGLRPATACL